MSDRPDLDARARAFFDGLWQQGDPWEFETSDFERQKYGRQLELLADRRYGRALEIGCGAGAFTMGLAGLADRVTAIDVSARAIAAARARPDAGGRIEFRAENVMDYAAVRQGPWDLVVMSDTVYYLGWLYSFFDVSWLAHEVYEAASPGGRLLLANTCGSADYLIRPWIVRTYHDLFANVGYAIEREDVLPGTKDGVALEMLSTRFVKAGAAC